MIRTEKDKTWAMNQIEDEHIRLRTSIALIKNMLSHLQNGDLTDSHYSKLTACLQKFYYEIKSHFFNEESHGALIDIKDEFPEVVKHQMQFNREHREFLIRIREMRKSVQNAHQFDSEKFQEIAKEFEYFCNDIVDHDQRETEAFQSAFYQKDKILLD